MVKFAADGAEDLDGVWEAAVAQVTVAGRPKIVFDASKQWNTLSGRTSDPLTYLGKLSSLLFDGKNPWKGKAANKYQDILKEIADEITSVQEDTSKLSMNLDHTGQTLADAIAHIPIPVGVGMQFLVFGKTHELPGGTDLDNGDAIHHPEKLTNAIVSDYQSAPDKWKDFRAFMRTAHGSAANRRTLTNQDHYRGESEPDISRAAAHREQVIDEWYRENAQIAGYWFNKLRGEYTDQRKEYVFKSHREHLVGDRDNSSGGNPSSPGGGGYDAEAPAFGAMPPSAAGGFGGSPFPGTRSPGIYGAEHGYQGWEPPKSVGARPGDGDAWSGDGYGSSGAASSGSGLAGAPSGLSTSYPGLSPGFGGGAGGVSLGTAVPPGMVSPGSNNAGPERSPMPPLTSPQETLLSHGIVPPGASSLRPTGVGMMPHGGGARSGERDERYTWLTEDDEDIFKPPPAPPGLIK